MPTNSASDFSVNDRVMLKGTRLFGKVVKVVSVNSPRVSSVTVVWDNTKREIPFVGDRISKLQKA